MIKYRTSSGDKRNEPSKFDSDNEEPNLTESESNHKTSNSGSGTDKPNHLWRRTTMEDTEPNEPTRNALGNQIQQ